jgi:transposase-like protein
MKNITKKSYSPAFKTRVVKEMLGQEKTVSQICSEYKIHPTQAHKWKKRGIEQIDLSPKN